MSIRTEVLPAVDGVPLTEVIYTDGSDTEPTQSTLRTLRRRAFEYIATDVFPHGRAVLSDAQHEAIGRFIALKKTTLGEGTDVLEAVPGVDCRVIIQDGVVHEVFGGDIPKYSQVLYPVDQSRIDNALSETYPGAIAMVTHNFTGV